VDLIIQIYIYEPEEETTDNRTGKDIIAAGESRRKQQKQDQRVQRTAPSILKRRHDPWQIFWLYIHGSQPGKRLQIWQGIRKIRANLK